ncbi:hypothetical protein QE152_g39160 [Popillia japonica]|uniref:Uncharacterized protein n=1 Tax=Popillia japonica TaxID=7064 RepID=A0AAW1HUR3_POPJA
MEMRETYQKFKINAEDELLLSLAYQKTVYGFENYYDSDTLTVPTTTEAHLYSRVSGSRHNSEAEVPDARKVDDDEKDPLALISVVATDHITSKMASTSAPAPSDSAAPTTPVTIFMEVMEISRNIDELPQHLQRWGLIPTEGVAWFGLVWPGLGWCGLTGVGVAWLGSV